MGSLAKGNEKDSAAFAEITKALGGKYPSLDRDKMLAEAFWLQYCCCKGVALGAPSNPFFASEARNFCIHQSCDCTSCGDPFCSSVGIQCCFTSQCAFPKEEGSPVCACCNKVLAGGGSEDKWKPKLFDLELGWKDQFWLYYLLCAGYAVQAPGSNNKPCLGSKGKQFCIQGEMECVMPPCPAGKDGKQVCCSSVGKQLCCYMQEQYPPVSADDGNTPFIACCGFRFKNKEKKHSGMCAYGGQA